MARESKIRVQLAAEELTYLRDLIVTHDSPPDALASDVLDKIDGALIEALQAGIRARGEK